MKDTINRWVMAVIARIPGWLKRVVYRMPWLRNAGNKILRPLMPEELTIVELQGEDMQGYRMQLKLHSEKSMVTGYYGPVLDPTLKHIIKEGCVVYDIGAHIGYYSLWFARRAGPTGAVVAFEPDPRTFEQLKTNININKVGNVKIVNAAVSDKSGSVSLRQGPITFDSYVIDGSVKADDITVPSVSLDDFIMRDGNVEPDVLKVDVEGHEVEVLTGAETVLARHRPIVHCELHGKIRARSVYRLLRRFSYTVRYVDETVLRDLPFEQYDFDFGHVIAWPKESPNCQELDTLTADAVDKSEGKR